MPGTVGQATVLTVDRILLTGRLHPDRAGWRGLNHDDVLAYLGELAVTFAPGRGGWADEYATDTALLAGKVADLLTGLGLLRSDAGTWWISPAANRWNCMPAASARGAAPSTSPTDRSLA